MNEIKVPQLAESLKGVGLKRHEVEDREREGRGKKWNVCRITDRTYPSGKEPTGGVWKGLASCYSLDAVAVVQAGQIFLTTTERER